MLSYGRISSRALGRTQRPSVRTWLTAARPLGVLAAPRVALFGLRFLGFLSVSLHLLSEIGHEAGYGFGDVAQLSFPAPDRVFAHA
jgi:hypothetical protein